MSQQQQQQQRRPNQVVASNNQQSYSYGSNRAGLNIPQPQTDQLIDPIQGTCNPKTHLIQLYTTHPDEGPRLISSDHSVGVPIMVIVDSACCCYCKLNVPHGIMTLEQRCGKHTGTLEPGYHCCYCSFKRISAMISKNTIRFNTPVEKCPTKDNVRITLDISINFHIGRDETRAEDCEKFLYYLGANRLQELLDQECNEKVRMLVRRTHVRAVRDLDSEMAHEILEDLSQRFNSLGIYFESVTILNVIIPKDLRAALSTSTAFDVHLQNQIKFQENTIIKLNNSQNVELLNLKRVNMKKLDVLNHTKVMMDITLEQERIKALTLQQEEIIKAQKEQSVKVIKAEAVKAQAYNNAQKKAEALMAESNAYAETIKISTDNKAEVLTANAIYRVATSKLSSQALITEADGEEVSSQNLINQRKHKERIKMAEQMTQLVGLGHIVMSGKQGDDFLNFFKDTVDQVNIKE